MLLDAFLCIRLRALDFFPEYMEAMLHTRRKLEEHRLGVDHNSESNCYTDPFIILFGDMGGSSCFQVLFNRSHEGGCWNVGGIIFKIYIMIILRCGCCSNEFIHVML